MDSHNQQEILIPQNIHHLNDDEAQEIIKYFSPTNYNATTKYKSKAEIKEKEQPLLIDDFSNKEDEDDSKPFFKGGIIQEFLFWLGSDTKKHVEQIREIKKNLGFKCRNLDYYQNRSLGEFVEHQEFGFKNKKFNDYHNNLTYEGKEFFKNVFMKCILGKQIFIPIKYYTQKNGKKQIVYCATKKYMEDIIRFEGKNGIYQYSKKYQEQMLKIMENKQTSSNIYFLLKFIHNFTMDRFDSSFK